MALGLRERESMASRLEAETFDLIVVGGGITGAGIFRDAALVLGDLRFLATRMREMGQANSWRKAFSVQGHEKESLSIAARSGRSPDSYPPIAKSPASMVQKSRIRPITAVVTRKTAQTTGRAPRIRIVLRATATPTKGRML